MKVYIGDSVYAEARSAFPFGAELVLTTENGGAPSNTIILGQDEWESLKAFVANLERRDIEEERVDGGPEDPS